MNKDIRNLFLKIHTLSICASSFYLLSEQMKEKPTSNEIQSTVGLCLLTYFISKHRNKFSISNPLLNNV